eukprot:Phypoly_transcript_03783.p1 GENE.Phypoly_transcript_03783~~Phypoly_transcript_03783.p1  ORF type:complete len:658 (+),score=101.38 Phypoly_transcript_03783:359-2332(+)
MFDNAQDNIFQLMKMDPYPRFLKSEAYSKLLMYPPNPSDFSANHSSTVSGPSPSQVPHPLSALVLGGFMHQAERQDGWVEMREHDGVILSWRKMGDMYCTRGIGIVACDPSELFHIINDIGKRKMWDDLFCEGRELERLDNELSICYLSWHNPQSSTQTQSPNTDKTLQTTNKDAASSHALTPRDFVVLRVARANKEDGSFLSVTKSVSHPNIPPQQGFVRGEMESSGFIIRPCGPCQSLVIYLAQVDPRGKLPEVVDTHLLQQRPLCILQLRQVVRKLKLPDFYANPFAASAPAVAGKRWNRASVYVPNTRIFDATNHSMTLANIWSGAGGSANPTSPPSEYLSYSPTFTHTLPNPSNGSDTPSDPNTTTHPHSKIENTELTSSAKTDVELATIPILVTEPTPQPLVDASSQSFVTHGPSPNPTLPDNKPELIVTPDGADTTKTITRRIIGTPPSSPITGRSKANTQLIIGTPPDSPSKIKSSHIIRSPPDSPISSKNKTNLLSSPGEATKNKFHHTLIPDSASDIKGNNNKTHTKVAATPPDSPNSMKSKSTSKLNLGTPPDSPSSLKSRSAGKINLSHSPYSSDGEFSDVDENTHSPTPKKKGSVLNLFAFAKSSSSVSPSTSLSSSGCDDEKQSIWQRATKKFNSSPKHSDGE